MHGGICLRIEHHLRLAEAVPKVNEYHATKITTRIDPTRERYGRPDCRHPKLAACMRPLFE